MGMLGLNGSETERRVLNDPTFKKLRAKYRRTRANKDAHALQCFMAVEGMTPAQRRRVIATIEDGSWHERKGLEHDYEKGGGA